MRIFLKNTNDQSHFIVRLLMCVVAFGLMNAMSLITRDCFAEDANECFVLASGHYQRSQWKQSIEYFEKLIQDYGDDPRVPGARFFLAEALVQKGDLELARQRYEEFVIATPEHKFLKRAHFRIAETSYLLEDFEVAYVELVAFRELWPDDELMEYVLPYLGQLEIDRSDINQGSVAKGIEYFESALRRFPAGVLADECRFGLGRALKDSNPAQSKRFFLHVCEKGKASLADDAAFELGRIYFTEGDYQRAADRLADFQERFAESEYQLQGLYWYARTLARSEKFEESKLVLYRVIEGKPTADIAASVLFEAAVVARQLNDHDESTRLLKLLVEQWPDSEWMDESLLLMSQNEYAAERYFSVIQYADTFLTQYPRNEFRRNVLELKGKSLLALEQNALSTTVFQELVESAAVKNVSPKRISGWNYLLGLGLFRDDRGAEAMIAFDRAARLTNDPALQSAVNLAKSTIHLDRREFSDAVEPLEAFLRIAKSESAKNQVRAELARTLTLVGNFDRADEVFDELNASDVDSETLAKLADSLAENAYREKQFELAAKWFQTVLANSQEKDDLARATSGLAWSLAELRKNEEAVVAFQKLVDNWPDSEVADEAALKLGMMLAELNRTDDAIATFCRFDKSYRDSELWPDAILNLVRITQKDGKKENLELAARQIESLMQNVSELKDDDEFLYQLAWLQNDLGDRKASESTFKTISHRHRSSKYWADASYRVAEIAVRENRIEEAKKVLDQLINTKVDTDEVAVHGIYLQGKIAVDQQDWPTVDRLMQKLISEYAGHTLCISAEYWRAESAYRQRDFDVAIERFDTLHRQTGDSQTEFAPGVALRRAQLWAKKDAWHHSKKIAESFVKTWPEHPSRYEADYLLGRFHAREGTYSSARKYFERVLESRESRATEAAAMSQFMIGESHMHQENYDLAIKAYHKVEILHQFPRWQSAALLQCGKCYELTAEWRDAVTCYERLEKEFESVDIAAEYVAEAGKRIEWARRQQKQN